MNFKDSNLSKCYSSNPLPPQTVPPRTGASLCEWLTLPKGYYVLIGKALALDGAEFHISNANKTDEIYAAGKDTGTVIGVAGFGSEETINFRVIAGSSQYVTYQDGTFFRLMAISISELI